MGWTSPIRAVRPSVGAGLVYAMAGGSWTMPGLPAHQAAERIDLYEDGDVVGLF